MYIELEVTEGAPSTNDNGRPLRVKHRLETVGKVIITIHRVAIQTTQTKICTLQ